MFRNYKLEVNNDILLEQWFSNGGAGMTGGAQASSGGVRGQLKPGFSPFSVQGLDLALIRWRLVVVFEFLTVPF